MTESHLVIDGSNIATEGRSDPSLSQLDEAVRAFLSEQHFDNVVVVVDATFPNRIDPSERDEYEAAINAGEMLTPPAGTVGRGDAFVLMIAERSGATVLSNDSFQEFHPEHQWLFDEGRLIGGKPVPGVGWVFVGRNPVKGPKSRRATAEARKKAARKSPASSDSKSDSEKSGAKKSPAKRGGRKAAAKKADEGSSTKGGAVKKKAPARKATKKASAEDGKDQSSQGGSSGRKRSRRRRSSNVEPINEPTVFLAFITDHQPGAIVDAEVVEFTSHGAYANVEGVRCYIPLKSMGDPPPNKARDVVSMGEVRPFVVQEYDTPRRGIVLALPGVGDAESGYREPPTSSGEDDGPATGTATTMKPAEEASVAAPKKKAPAKR